MARRTLTNIEWVHIKYYRILSEQHFDLLRHKNVGKKRIHIIDKLITYVFKLIYRDLKKKSIRLKWMHGYLQWLRITYITSRRG